MVQSPCVQRGGGRDCGALQRGIRTYQSPYASVASLTAGEGTRAHAATLYWTHRDSNIGDRIGCGPTAGLMVYGTADEQRAAVQRAYEVGITYFDTAPIYGDYVSEENLGRALQAAGIRPQIATKVALETPDLEDIRGAVRKSVDDSLRVSTDGGCLRSR